MTTILPNDTVTVDGEDFLALPETPGAVCRGCVADTDSGLCGKVSNQARCSENRIIFVRKIKEAPDFSQAFGQPAGRKDDSGKLDVTLFFNDLPHAIEGVTEVLQWAITKKQPVPYARGSWQFVTDFQRRYQGAQLRHELNRAKSAIAGQPEQDAETELLELAHIATDAMFRLEMAIRKRKGLTVPEGA